MFAATLATLAIAIGAVWGTPTDNPDAREIPPYFAKYVSVCDGRDPVYVHVPTRTLYGDQDGNGRLEGSECDDE